ncbi:MAG: helix-turn-helix domain-containing protein [Gammaproteobacteria bacterium]|nr:helix-turn-helix domain-containing protein [Gammaproteobacteria bacterium]
MRSNPNSTRARNNYGAFLFAQERYRDAIDHLEKASEDRYYEGRPTVFENLGVSYLRIGEREKAEQAFDRAVALNPDQPRALLELAKIRFERQEYVPARQMYRRYQQVSNQNAKSLWLCIRLARVFENENEEASCALALRNPVSGVDRARGVSGEFVPMTESDIPEESAAVSSVETVSQRLVRAREARGLSQKEVADELFLTTTFIRYLEDGDFEKIPKPAFIKGYLRSYARVVGLDSDDLVAAFEQEQNIAPQTPKLIDVTKSAEPPTGFSGPVIQTGVIGLIGIIVVGAAVWWIASDTAPGPSVTSVSEPPDAVEETTLPDVVDESTPEPVRSPAASTPAESDSDDSMARIAGDVVEDTATDDSGEDGGEPTEAVPQAGADEAAVETVEPAPDSEPGGHGRRGRQ